MKLAADVEAILDEHGKPSELAEMPEPSPEVQQAIAWFYSEEAGSMSCSQARAYVREHFGLEVDSFPVSTPKTA